MPRIHDQIFTFYSPGRYSEAAKAGEVAWKIIEKAFVYMVPIVVTVWENKSALYKKIVKKDEI
ncbi:MAG: hypothetical protein Kow0042_04870 [Calditrichia bacterium]